jgi:hypothetical protein
VPKDRRRLLFLFLAVTLVVGLGYMALSPMVVTGAEASGSSSAEANTPYGESLTIKLGSSSKTSGSASWLQRISASSWLASYSNTASQNVYTVNGTYKSQELVTLSYSLSVTYSNVDSIEATVKVKATSDSYSHEYTLASGKSLTGSSPISDSGSTAPTITQHLTDIGCSTSGATVQYEIYCQVTATGSISGSTLTATVPYTQFGQLVYQQSSESNQAQVTPTVSVASWDEQLGLPRGTIIDSATILTIIATVYVVHKRRPRR